MSPCWSQASREPIQIAPLPPGTIVAQPPPPGAVASPPPASKPGDKAGVTADNHLVLTAQFCANLATYAPPPDITYKPGVDVYGHPVAPADLPNSAGAQITQPIPILLDARRLTGVPRQAGVYPLLITVDPKSGVATLNGHPIDRTDEATLAQLCRAQGLVR
jgi:hypothetical protein